MIDGDPRDKQIESLLTVDWRAFEVWRSESGAFQTLSIPSDVANVFIPRRLMELAHDPANLRTILFETGERNLRFKVVERFDEPISDPQEFAKWQDTNKALLRRVRTNAEVLSTLSPKIDLQHALNEYLVRNGTLFLEDKLYLEYSADVRPDFPHLVETRSYTDREDMQRIGIGTSFYERLEQVLRSLGFRYLAGKIISKHPGFFAKTRTAYKDLPEEIKEDLPEDYSRSLTDVMVKVL